MHKICEDLQNLIIAYLDLTTYSTLNQLNSNYNICRYEKIHTSDLIKTLNSRLLDTISKIKELKFIECDPHNILLNFQKYSQLADIQIVTETRLEREAIKGALSWTITLCLIDILELFKKLEIMDSDYLNIKSISSYDLNGKPTQTMYFKAKIMKNFYLYKLNELYIPEKNSILVRFQINKSDQILWISYFDLKSDHIIINPTYLWNLFQECIKLYNIYT